jgi:hypothetical protein
MDNNHETSLNKTLDYANCPPASGPHYNIAGRGPLKRAFYGPDTQTNPGGWVHNLEHGFAVVAYSCKNGCPTTGELDALRAWMDSVPKTPGADNCVPPVPNKAMVVRFDEMTTKYAALAWDRALLMDTFDAEAATEFAMQRIDQPPVPEPGAACN